MTHPSEPEGTFEHPAFGSLYIRVLCDVADRRLDERAAARALAFLLREQVVDEAVATDVLTALRKSLDLPSVVRTLLLGLRDALGDHERITEWTRAVAGRAVIEGHVESFVTAMRILVELHDYDGTIPAQWRLAILRAAEVPELAPRALCFCREYASRFPSESSGWWVRQARAACLVAVLRQCVTIEQMREARQS